MAVTVATVTSLSADPGAAGVVLVATYSDLQYPDGLDYLQAAAVEIWASETNDRTTATFVAEGPAQGGVAVATHTELDVDDTWYYWAKMRNAAGDSTGEFFPVSPTAGVRARAFLDTIGWVPLVGGPTIAAGTGSITSYSASLHYKIRGMFGLINVSCTVSDNGTGSNYIKITGLPFTGEILPFGVGWGKMGDGFGGGGSATNAHKQLTVEHVINLIDFSIELRVRLYDGSYPIAANGDSFIIQTEFAIDESFS